MMKNALTDEYFSLFKYFKIQTYCYILFMINFQLFCFDYLRFI